MSQEDLHHAKAEGPLAKKRKLETSFLGSDNDSQRSGESDNVPQMKHDPISLQEEEHDSGPQFHANEKVLVLDSTRAPQQMYDNETNKPPLYEATIKQSGLRHVDPLTNKVLSETKFAFAKKRGRRRLPTQSLEQHSLSDQEKQWCYLVHFLGWNSRHDRWMIEHDVFPNTDENRTRLESASVKQIGRVLKVDAQEEIKKKEGRSKPKKAKTGEVDSDAVSLLIEACELPFTLQRKLIDDCDKITKTIYPPSSIFSPRRPEETYKRGITMLHELPSLVSIQMILARFLEKRKKDDLEEFVRERNAKGDSNAEGENSQIQQQFNNDVDGDTKAASDHEILDPKKSANKSIANKVMTKDILKLRKKKRKQLALSILELVDLVIPKALLYAEEQNQYAEFMSEKCSSNDNARLKRPSEIYGGEYLLRLFVKLPDLIASTTIPNVDNVEVAELAEFLAEFIVFLQQNCAQCFKDRYYSVAEG